MSTDLTIDVAPPPQSKSRQLAKLLPAIELALAEGHSHEVIHDHIKNTVGLDLTYKYYKTTLHRIRKKRDQAMATSDNRKPEIQTSVADGRTLVRPTGLNLTESLATRDAGPLVVRFVHDTQREVTWEKS